MDTLHLYENRMPRNHKHPALLIKALSETFNKTIASLLDTLTFFLAALSLTFYCAATSIIGTDQEGQIVFELSLNNCYLPIISILFSVFFMFFFNVLSGMFLRPTSGSEVRTYYNAQKYVVLGFLIGFQSLAAYLCLPAEFVVK